MSYYATIDGVIEVSSDADHIMLLDLIKDPTYSEAIEVIEEADDHFTLVFGCYGDYKEDEICSFLKEIEPYMADGKDSSTKRLVTHGLTDTFGTKRGSPTGWKTAYSGLRKTIAGLKSGKHMSSFAGEGTAQVGRQFLKSYAGVCLQGAIIILACIIYSVFAESVPMVDDSASAISAVWSYLLELIINMLVLVGAVRMSDRIIHEMIGM